jgi:hypothetical protein
MSERRAWTAAEQLLDELYHNPELVNRGEWRNRVAQILPRCPRNQPDGTSHEVTMNESPWRKPTRGWMGARSQFDLGD